MANAAYQSWYKTQRWRKFRLAHLKEEPLCRMCLRHGKMTMARVADHVEPHRGNPSLFWDGKNLQSLCLLHANSEKQKVEIGWAEKVSIGEDGFPR